MAAHFAHHVPHHLHHDHEHQQHVGFMHSDNAHGCPQHPSHGSEGRPSTSEGCPGTSRASQRASQNPFRTYSMNSSIGPGATDEHYLNSSSNQYDESESLHPDASVATGITDGSATGKDYRKNPVIDSHIFVGVISFFVLVNACTMGLEVDHPEWEILWFICENVFTIVFAFEMVIKVWVLGRHYFYSGFNLLDFFLAWLSIIDLWLIPLVMGSTDAIDLQSLSILRILRMARLVRVVKLVKHAPQMVLVISGVVEAMQTTFWIGLVLWVFVYIFGIFFTRIFGQDSAELYPGFSVEMEEIDEQEIMANYNPYLCFGTLDRSIITLFNIAILSEWGEIVRPIYVKQPWFFPFFLVFVMFVTFGVMNVFIGMIVDRVTTNARQIEDDKIQQEKENKVKQIDKMRTLIFEDGRGALRPEELAKKVEKNDQLRDLFDKTDLPHYFTEKDLVHMLDNDGDGMVDDKELVRNFKRLVMTNEFHSLCMMQTGINEVKYQVRSLKQTLRRDLGTFFEEMTRRFNVLEANMQNHGGGPGPGGDAGAFYEEINRRFNALEANLQNRSSGPGPGGDDRLAAESPPAEEEPLGEPATSGIASQREVGGVASKTLAAAPDEPEPASRQMMGASLQRSGSGLSGSSQRPLLARRAEVQQDHDEVSASAVPSGTKLGNLLAASGKDEHEAVTFDRMGNRIVEESVQFEGRSPLGFEVKWSWPPTVGLVHKGSQAAKKGLQSGDVLVECNGVQMAGKTRAELLDLLMVRPLTVKIGRHPERTEIGHGWPERSTHGMHIDRQVGGVRVGGV